MNLELDADDTLAWQAAQDADARIQLRALPAYDIIRRSLERLMVASPAMPLKRAGNRWFQQVRLDPRADEPVLVVRESPTGEPRIVLDPNELTAKRGAPVTLVWFSPSPDGSMLLYGLDIAGIERREVTLLDVETGSPLPDEIPWNPGLAPSWLPDSTGFWCDSSAVVEGEQRITIHRHTVGSPAPIQPVPAPDGLVFPRPVVSPDGRHVVLITGNAEPRTEYILDDEDHWQPFLQDVPGFSIGEFDDDTYVAIIDDGHPRGRLVRIPVATVADRSTWTELVAEGDDVLRAVAVFGDRIVLSFLRGGACGLRVIDADGRALSDLELPGIGSAGVYLGYSQLNFPMFLRGEGEISFLHATPASSPVVYRYLVGSDELIQVSEPELTIDGLVVRQLSAISTDGAAVPVTMMYRDNLDMAVPQPTLLHGYGGYAVGITPSYEADAAAFTEAGGIYVIAHLRGGSELGAQWWRQGRRDRKQQVFDDLYAVAEHLIAEGITTPAQLAVEGASNGGTLTGVALTQRPDLFAAVISRVPQLDLLGLVRDPVGYAICRVEYGDPHIPEEAEWLRAFSPRHNIHPGTPYPATLFTAGAHDPRCPAWHARVMTAELREAQAAEAPILLRVHADQGHGPSGLADLIDQTAEWLAFAASHTGLIPA